MLYTVIGAGGFIGGRMAAHLKALGAELYLPERGDSALFSRDLGRVFYCAGLTNDFAKRPFDTIEAHVSLLSRVLQKASFEHLVYLSSTRLYDGLPQDMCAEDVSLSVSPANPRHLFDLSKALGENLCLTVAGDRAAVARLSSVYDSADDATGFFSALLQRLRKERGFILDSSAGAVRDYIHIGDVVASLMALAAGQKGIFNVACGKNISNREIVDVLNANGCAISLKQETAREHQAECDIAKLQALGLNPVLPADYLKNFLKG